MLDRQLQMLKRTYNTRIPDFWGWVHKIRFTNTISIINLIIIQSRVYQYQKGKHSLFMENQFQWIWKSRPFWFIFLPQPSHKPWEIFPERSSVGVEKRAEKEKNKGESGRQKRIREKWGLLDMHHTQGECTQSDTHRAPSWTTGARGQLQAEDFPLREIFPHCLRMNFHTFEISLGIFEKWLDCDV